MVNLIWDTPPYIAVTVEPIVLISKLFKTFSGALAPTLVRPQKNTMMLHPQTQIQPLLFILESREMLMNGAFKCKDTIPSATIMLLALEGPTFTVQKMSTTKKINCCKT